MAELAFVLLLAGHLLTVNVAAAGPLVCIWFEWREGRGNELAGSVGRQLAAVAIVSMIIGTLLGFLIGWHNWTPAYKQLVLHLGSRVSWGVVELVFSFLLMILHLWWWYLARNPATWTRTLRCIIPLAASTNLLYHFPILFIILSNLANQGQVPDGQLDSAGFRELMMHGDVVARTVHFWLASIAVTGIVVTWLTGRQSSTDKSPAAIWGGRIALVPTVLQIPTGIWLLMELPGSDQDRLMGEDLVGTGLLGASIVLSLLLMHQLLAISTGDVARWRLRLCTITMVTVVVLMTGTLRRLDRIETAPAEETSTTLETTDGTGDNHDWRFRQRGTGNHFAWVRDELFSLSGAAKRFADRRAVVC